MDRCVTCGKCIEKEEIMCSHCDRMAQVKQYLEVAAYIFGPAIILFILGCIFRTMGL